MFPARPHTHTNIQFLFEHLHIPCYHDTVPSKSQTSLPSLALIACMLLACFMAALSTQAGALSSK